MCVCVIAIISMTWCSQAWNKSEPCYCDYAVSWSVGWPMGTMNWNYPFHDDYCDGGKNNWKLKINYAWKCCVHTDSGKLVIHHPVLFVHIEISKQYLLFLNDSMAILKGFKERVPKHDTASKSAWLVFLRGAQREIFPLSNDISIAFYFSPFLLLVSFLF